MVDEEHDEREGAENRDVTADMLRGAGIATGMKLGTNSLAMLWFAPLRIRRLPAAILGPLRLAWRSSPALYSILCHASGL